MSVDTALKVICLEPYLLPTDTINAAVLAICNRYDETAILALDRGLEILEYRLNQQDFISFCNSF